MKECEHYDNWCEKEKRTCNNCYYERGYNMSDEENEAIESFKEENNNDLSRFDYFNSYTQFKVKRDKLIIELIEKQSKEIEELKKQDLSNSKIIANMSTRHFNDREKIRKYETLQDKIKAKIEELKEDIKYSANPLSIDNSKIAIKVLQSLLNEEE